MVEDAREEYQAALKAFKEGMTKEISFKKLFTDEHWEEILNRRLALFYAMLQTSPDAQFYAMFWFFEVYLDLADFLVEVVPVMIQKGILVKIQADAPVKNFLLQKYMTDLLLDLADRLLDTEVNRLSLDVMTVVHKLITNVRLEHSHASADYNWRMINLFRFYAKIKAETNIDSLRTELQQSIKANSHLEVFLIFQYAKERGFLNAIIEAPQEVLNVIMAGNCELLLLILSFYSDEDIERMFNHKTIDGKTLFDFFIQELGGIMYDLNGPEPIKLSVRAILIEIIRKHNNLCRYFGHSIANYLTLDQLQ